MKQIKTGINFLKVRYLNRKIPVFLSISVTDKCNFKCKYCDVHKRKTKEMSTEEIKRCVDEFAKMGTKKIGFCGGEPTLRKDIRDLIDHAKIRGMVTTMTSNGFLIPERINELKNIDILILSLDGSKEVHDNIRSKGSYDKLMESLKLCAQNKIKVWTITVLTKSNIKEIDFILDLASKMNFQTIFQPVYNYQLYRGSLTNLAPSISEFNRAINKVIKAKKDGANVASSFDYLNSISSWPRIQRKTKCWAGKSYAYVDTDGKVYPCIDLIDKIDAKSGLELGFEKAFQLMPETNCKGCWINCYLENDLITALKPLSILNVIKKV